MVLEGQPSKLTGRAEIERKWGYFPVSLCQFSSKSLFLCVDRECKVVPLVSLFKDWNCNINQKIMRNREMLFSIQVKDKL